MYVLAAGKVSMKDIARELKFRPSLAAQTGNDVLRSRSWNRGMEAWQLIRGGP
jgi:hypothetical protein